MSILISTSPTAQAQAAPAETSSPGIAAEIRYEHLDWLRLLAILDVASLHVSSYHVLGGLGLPIFLLCSLALVARRRQAVPFAPFARQRAERLLMPWLFWSGVFIVYRLLVWWLHWKEPLSHFFEWHMFFYGGLVHLWYLPFIYVSELALNRTMRLMREWTAPAIGLTGIVLGTLTAIGISQLPLVNLSHPYKNWITALPALGLGLGLGMLISVHPRQIPRWLRGLAVAASVVMILWGMSSKGMTPLDWCWPWRYGWAVLALVLATLHTGRIPGWLKSCANLGMGIYLVHPVVGSNLILDFPQTIRFLPATLASALIVLLMRQTSLRRFV